MCAEKQQANKAETCRGSLGRPFPCSGSEGHLEIEEEKAVIAERVWKLTLGYGGAMPAPWPRCGGTPVTAAPCACVPVGVEGSCVEPAVVRPLRIDLYVCVRVYTHPQGAGGSLLCRRAAEAQRDCRTPRDGREVGNC